MVQLFGNNFLVIQFFIIRSFGLGLMALPHFYRGNKMTKILNISSLNLLFLLEKTKKNYM